MSWQSYVDTNLLGAGFEHATIIGHDGGVWATSKGYSLQGKEGANLAELFKNPSLASQGGIHASGKKYMCVKSDPRSVYGKLGAGGIVLVKTTTGILVAVYNDKLQAGAAANIVETLGDYLIANNC